MPVYTVNIPGGTNDHDFEAYKRLLEEAGVDLSAAPRIHDPGTSQRWLYVWHDRAFAERFARELQTRTRNKRWEVNELESSLEQVGPLAPLDIVASISPDGEFFRLTPTSQNRIMTRFPNARLVNELLWSADEREGHERQHGSICD